MVTFLAMMALRAMNSRNASSSRRPAGKSKSTSPRTSVCRATGNLITSNSTIILTITDAAEANAAETSAADHAVVSHAVVAHAVPSMFVKARAKVKVQMSRQAPQKQTLKLQPKSTRPSLIRRLM